jgi:hypothetical protein
MFHFPTPFPPPSSPSHSFPANYSSLPMSSVTLPSNLPSDVAFILQQFPSVVSPFLASWPQPSYNTTHALYTSGPPICKSLLSFPIPTVCGQIHFSGAGTLRHCHSDLPWSLPVHMAPKPNDSWHPCGDYRHLNTVTIPDKISFTKFARPFHPSPWCNNILQTGPIKRLLSDTDGCAQKWRSSPHLTFLSLNTCH